MKYVGIDIAKKFHIACILDESNNYLKKNYRIESELTDFDMFYQVLELIDKDKSQFLIGMEATGLLFENLYLFLKSLGYNVVLLNPYQTTKFREMDTMKYVKNDNIDSQMIAALLKSGRYSEGYVSEDIYQAIKSLYRHKATLMQEMKSAKRQVSTTLAVVFPEFENIIRDPFSVSGMALLNKYPTAKHYKGASGDRILKVFRNIKGNNFNLDKANNLLDLAMTTVYQGNAKEERAYVILSNLRRIRFLKEEMEQCEVQMFTLLNESEQAVSASISKDEEVYIADLVDNLRSIDGVSDKTIFKVYLDKKSSGRAPKECIVVVARKLAMIIYSIYKNNTPYNPARVFNTQASLSH
ncbi:MAG: IS110 family transposase [Campylobacterota bacterium]|nr:IS110 family transposase [Campylobacterota bacterium]